MTDDTSAPPLDLDAIEARIAACARLCAWEEGDGCREVATQRCAGGNCGLRLCEAHAEAHSNEAAHDTYPLPRNAVPEARALLAEVRRLRALRDDIADAFDGLVMKVWRATGETHEPPADVEAMLARVAQLRAVRDMAVTSDARREGAEAMREACAEVAAEHEAAARSRRSAFHHDDRGYDIADAAIDECEEVAAAIRALPLPEAPQ